MKKSMVLLVSALVFLSGCSLFSGDNGQQNKELKVKDVFPFSENMYYYYEGIGINYAEWEIYVEYLSGNRLQRRLEIPETNVFVEVLENIDGELRLIYTGSDYYETEDFTELEPESYQVALKEPFELGAKWVVANGVLAEITNMKANVETPYGTFKAAIEITKKSYSSDGSESIKKEYYVVGLGMVKSVTYTSSGAEIISQLAVVEEVEG